MQRLLAKTARTVGDIVPFGVLLALFIFVFAILGGQACASDRMHGVSGTGGNAKPLSEEPPRARSRRRTGVER